MKSVIRTAALSLLGALLVGCETRETVETELYITELEQQVTELETQLNAAYTEVSRLSGTLSARVGNLEASLNDLNLRVMDLPTGDPQFTIREVEAAVAVTQQRLAEVRAATDELARYVE